MRLLRAVLLLNLPIVQLRTAAWVSLLCFGVCLSQAFAQTTLPLSRTTWSATPTGWTDNSMGTYTSTLTCDGNSNRGRLDATGDYTQVFFSGNPIMLSFDLQGNTIGATSSLLVEESANGSAWTTVANILGISAACVTYTYNLTCATTTYVRWTYTKVSGNLAIDNVSITTGTCAGPGSVCPSLTGAILNSCDNGVAGCNEGDGEILFMNTGTYSLNVACLPSGAVNYYGSTTSYTTPTVDASTGSFTSNAAATSTLNASTGCTGNFIDAAAAGTIPAGATVMMVPATFCSTNYDFSSLCASFSPIYVLYFGTSNWSSTGNLANQQSPAPKPKYLTMNLAAACDGCSTQYYTYDANTEASGNGAGVSFSGSISTSSASPTNPAAYTSASCLLPLVLPVDLLAFTVSRTAVDEAELQFTTLREENLESFSVSRSQDGIVYTPFATVSAHNVPFSTTYTVLDEIDEHVTPVMYYRLEEKDRSGAYKVLGHAILEIKPVREVQVLYDHEELTVSAAQPLQGLTLLSVSGDQLLALSGNGTDTSYTIDMRNLPCGFYMLVITGQNGSVQTRKIVR